MIYQITELTTKIKGPELASSSSFPDLLDLDMSTTVLDVTPCARVMCLSVAAAETTELSSLSITDDSGAVALRL
jgi:ABC-type dipeptide/oligopeptide/nickel transport system ATPase component